MPRRPPTAAPRREPEPRETLERVYGLAAALAVLRTSPERVIRIAHTKAVRAALREALRDAARRRIAYKEIEDEELARIAGAIHHEGVCLLVRGKRPPTLDLLARSCEPRGLLVALDGVANPHNVGAVLRTAAFFGAGGLLAFDPSRQTLTPAAVRIAQGGAEHVPVATVADLPRALAALQGFGLVLVGAENRSGGTALGGFPWPERCVLCLGKEDEGLSAAVRKQCDALVRIPGSKVMDSLNVSVAAGVLLASFAAQAR